MQLCKRESLKDWLQANFERDHVFCLPVFEQVSGYSHVLFCYLEFSIEIISIQPGGKLKQKKTVWEYMWLLF